MTAYLVAQIIVGDRFWVPGRTFVANAEAAEDDPAPPIPSATPSEMTEHASAVGFDYGVDPNSGSFGTKIPIETPPGRLGVQPALALTYSSTSAAPSIVGAGWSLALPAVRAEPLATWGGSTSYLIDGNRLIETAPGTFVTERETYARIRMACVTGGCTFTADDRNGQRLRFGGTAEARRVGRFGLDRVEDAHGNYMTIAYETDADLTAQFGAGNTTAGALLPKEIRYTGSPTRAPWYRVVFDYELRPAADIYYYDALQLRYRVRAIRVLGGDNAVIRTYTLAYTASANSARSLLASVSVTGLAGATGPSPFTMSYVTSPAGLLPFAAPTQLPAETRAVSGDFNGDGRSDLMTFRRRNSSGVLVNRWEVQLGGATGLGPLTTWLSFQPYNWPGTCGDAADHVYAGDWDADGDTDLFLYSKGCGAPLRWRVLESINSTFVVRDWIPAATTTVGSAFDAQNAALVFADFTGDGRADVLRHRPSDNATTLVQSLATGHAVIGVSTSASGVVVGAGEFNGDGKMDLVFDTGASLMTVCAETSSWFSPCGSLSRTVGAPRLGDFSGDGKVDVLLGNTQLANGLALGFAPEPVSVSPYGQVADIDGDGRDDLMQIVDNGNSTFTLRTELRRGGGFVAGSTAGYPDLTTPAVPSCWYLPGLQLTDVTGDGRADPLVVLRSAAGNLCNDYQFATRVVEAPALDRLSTILTPTGMSLQATYKRSLDASSASLVVVDELRVRDFPRPSAKGLISPVLETHRYTFVGNRWDGARHELTGFTSVSDQVVERDLTVRSSYLADVAHRGKPNLRATVRTSTNALISGDLYYYESDDTPPYAGELAWHLRMYFAADGSISARTLQGYTYDAAGNVTAYADHGMCDRTDDDRYVVTQYRSATDFNVQRPFQVTLYAGAPAPTPSIPGLASCTGGSLSLIESTLHEYDGSPVLTRGDLTRTHRLKVAPDGSQAWVRTRDYAYRPDGLLSSTTDARGYVSSVLSYDATLEQYPALVRDAAGNEELRSYEPHFGKVSAVTDANNQSQAIAYDGFGRLRSIRTPLAEALWMPNVTYAYGDTFPNWRAQVRPYQTGDGAMQGAASVTFLDGLGRSIGTVRDGDSMTERVISGRTAYWAASQLPVQVVPPTETAVDSCGSILTCLASWAMWTPAQITWPGLLAAPAGPPAQFTYDPLGRATRRDNPDGSFVTYTHSVDGLGFGLTEIDEVGDQKRLYRDARGDLARVERWRSSGASPEITTYRHDARRKLTSIVTPLGTTTTLRHDSLGRLDRVVSPELGQLTLGYDLDGHETSRTDARGVNTVTSVDELGRPTLRATSTGEFAMYAYDRDWLCLFSCVAPADADNTMGRPWAAVDLTGQISYAYDRDGHVARETRYLNGGTYVTAYENHASGQVVRKTYPDGEQHRFALAPDGRPSALYVGAATLPSVEVKRDAHGRPSSVWYGSHAHMQFRVDPITQRIDSIDTFDPADESIQHVGYGYRPDGMVESVERTDALGGDESLLLVHDGTKRLTDVFVQPDTATPAEHYDYDADGRVTAAAVRDEPAVAFAYGDPQHPHAVTQIGARALGYDAAGNRVTDGAAVLGYDSASRLTSHGAAQYAYDADGRRAIERGPGGTRLSFAGYTVEPDGSTRKQLALDGARFGERSSVTGERYFHADAVGSVIGESGAAGTLATSRTFSAFGSMLDLRGSGASRFGFAGYQRDDTGLYFANARYYDPSTASFTSPDSWLYGLDNPDALNAYAYAANSPYHYADPSGHILLELALIAGVTFAIGLLADTIEAGGHPDWGYVIVKNLALGALAGATWGLTSWAVGGAGLATLMAHGAVQGGASLFFDDLHDGQFHGGVDYLGAVALGVASSLVGAAGGVLVGAGFLLADAPLNPAYTVGLWMAITSASINWRLDAVDASRQQLEAPAPSSAPRVPACGGDTSGRTLPMSCERLAP